MTRIPEELPTQNQEEYPVSLGDILNHHYNLCVYIFVCLEKRDKSLSRSAERLCQPHKE